MRRFGVVALIVLSALLAFSGRARAVTEFCPAQVGSWQAVNAVASSPLDKTAAAQVYGLQLDARSVRTLEATVLIETDAGWFKSTFAALQFARGSESPSSSAAKMFAQTFESPEVFVRFPSAVRVVRMWVGSATVSEDGGFGWAGKGRVVCDPDQTLLLPNYSKRDRDLGTSFETPRSSPRPDEQIASAVATAAQDDLTCAKPFADATAIHAGSLRYPRGVPPGKYTINVVVAIDKTGRVADVWPLRSITGSDPSTLALTAATMEAAQASTFGPAIAFCRPVGAFYNFRADFSSYR